MYRKWLGDCFLLTFRDGDKESHIMIDCGALSGTPQAKDKLAWAVQDIVGETKGKLSALVVTHEHWDHVSGFSDAHDAFGTFTEISEVWAAWTEDPDQTVAKERKNQNQLRFQAIESALQSWGESSEVEDQQRGAAVSDLMRFMPPGGFAAFSPNTNAAMKTALSLGNLKLLSPGDMFSVAPGVKVYVLGPPKDAKALHTMAGAVGTDMYGVSYLSSTFAATEAFAAAAKIQSGSTTQDRYIPFEQHLQWEREPWAQRWKHLSDSYDSDNRRKIDRDWLNTAAELALQLDSYTNNTSLVLAFELFDESVLLFVGDAQIGNWKSWMKVTFSDSKVTPADLLARTIFYKVGHHGSHNATLMQGGLELMKSPRLVAAIPVDEEFAHRPKGRNPEGWDMPAGPLLKALVQKTRGHVLRGDSDFPSNASNPTGLSMKEWEEFKQNTNVQEHFVEYYIR